MTITVYNQNQLNQILIKKINKIKQKKKQKLKMMIMMMKKKMKISLMLKNNNNFLTKSFQKFTKFTNYIMKKLNINCNNYI